MKSTPLLHEARLRRLNDEPVISAAKSAYVLYWMQQSQRSRFNHALEYAIEQANTLSLPVIVCFGLMDDYPEANERHYAFMLQGLRDVEKNLRKRGILFVVKHGSPGDVAIHFAKRAAIIVTDMGYTRHQRAWRQDVAKNVGCRVVQVESDAVVPVETVSSKPEFAARTIRPKISKRLDEFLKPLKEGVVKRNSLRLQVAGNIDPTDPDSALAKLKVDRSVKRVSAYEGGEDIAALKLKKFMSRGLQNYANDRNEPSLDATSHLSMHLHFGQISPVEISLRITSAKSAPQAERETFVEELIVRRELAFNYCHFNPKTYDRYEGIPSWAKMTLAERTKDERYHVYSREQLETAQTHDPYWNAAQMQMNKTGFMHNYMRMYWGKKILEWKRTPEEAYADLLHLNNKLFLDGRDPVGFANVAWIFGLHDRPWGPARPIFGTVRYMNQAGLERKFDMEAYVKYVASLETT